MSNVKFLEDILKAGDFVERQGFYSDSRCQQGLGVVSQPQKPSIDLRYFEWMDGIMDSVSADVLSQDLGSRHSIWFGQSEFQRR